MRNFTGQPIELEIRRPFPGHIVFRSALGAVTHDYQTVQFTAKVPSGRRVELRYEVVQHMGRNEKQANVKLVEVKLIPGPTRDSLLSTSIVRGRRSTIVAGPPV